MRKIWDKIVAFICKVPYDKLLHFVCGVIIAAFFAIVLNMKLCFWPVLFVAFIKEFFDVWTGGRFDGWDFAATVIGSLVIQLFVII